MISLCVDAGSRGSALCPLISGPPIGDEPQDRVPYAPGLVSIDKAARLSDRRQQAERLAGRLGSFAGRPKPDDNDTISTGNTIIITMNSTIRGRTGSHGLSIKGQHAPRLFEQLIVTSLSLMCARRTI